VRTPHRCVDHPSGNKHRKYESVPAAHTGEHACKSWEPQLQLRTTVARRRRLRTAHHHRHFGSTKKPCRHSIHFCSCGIRYLPSPPAPARPGKVPPLRLATDTPQARPPGGVMAARSGKASAEASGRTGPATPGPGEAEPARRVAAGVWMTGRLCCRRRRKSVVSAVDIPRSRGYRFSRSQRSQYVGADRNCREHDRRGSGVTEPGCAGPRS
jgi:hypothetical protein